MDFTDRTIVLDGYNLELTQGTGIKRYAEDVLHTVREAGAKTGILFSCPTAEEADVQSALMYESSRDLGTLFDMVLRSPRLLRAITTGLKAERIHPTEFTLPATTQPEIWHTVDKCYSVPACFAIANRISQLSKYMAKIRMPRDIDLMHLTAPVPMEVPDVPVVTTIHDLIPLRMPWSCRDHKRQFYRAVKASLENSNAVICISEATRRDIIELFDVDERKLHLTYEPVPSDLPEFDDDTIERRLQPFGLEPDNYLLFVGAAMDGKKNLKRLLNALTMIDRDIPIVIVGPMPPGPLDRALGIGNRLSKQNRLQPLGYVPKDDLACLYQGCRAFLFPSLYEGFGLPPLEAIRFKRPVLSSNRASLPEVCGDAAIYVDPMDVEDIAEKTTRLIDDASLRAELVSHAPTQIEKFSEENYRTLLLGAYTAAMRA